MKNTRPLFTVIVPTFNQAEYLGPALDSLGAQTESDWEAVVVNDGSTDSTATVLDDYSHRDKRIRAIHKPNGGVASALNAGLAHARGDWVCWLSSDDLFDPRKLEINRSYIAQYPDCRFFFSYFRVLWDSTGEITNHELWGPLPDRELQILTLFYRNYISGISICIHRKSWDEIGNFNENLRYAQDFDMWLRLLSVYPAIFIPEWTVINRTHPGQGSEVFPEACYFDTAKASIEYINGHAFTEFFPLLELNDERAADSVLTQAMEIAAEPSAYVYSLGYHPALWLRILEWVWSDAVRDGSLADRMRQAVRASPKLR